MKIKYCIFLVAICTGFLFMACKREMPVYGEAYIYMPQATVSGGIDNMYVVPSGGGNLTYNFKSDNGKIDIPLGVSRSATFKGEGFTVDIVVHQDKTNEFVASGIVPNAVSLPANSYVLPSQVTVAGSNSATFYLSVDSAMLINDLAYTGQKMVLAVGIANPTAYAISDINNLTMVIIDVDAMRDQFFKYREGFLYRKGNKLMLNGKAYQCAGINSAALSGCGSGDETFSDEAIDALFASLPDNVLVRTWAFPGNNAHTDKIIKAAERNNIKLILVLGDQNGSCGDAGDKNEEWYTSGFRGDFLTHVKDMASTYKSSPAIGMWEMLNEPTMWNASVEHIKSFYNEVAMELKKADPNHLVATGSWAPWAYDGPEAFQSIHNSNYIDVGSLHEGDQDIVESWHFGDAMQAMKALNKVLIVSDISAEGGDAGCFYDKAGRAEMMKSKFDLYLEKEAGAALASYLVNGVSGECSNRFTVDDPIMDVIKTLPANSNLGK